MVVDALAVSSSAGVSTRVREVEMDGGNHGVVREGGAGDVDEMVAFQSMLSEYLSCTSSLHSSNHDSIATRLACRACRSS